MWRFLVVGIFCWLGGSPLWVDENVAAEPQDSPEALEFFEKNIRPVLVTKCYACHSQEAAQDGKLKGGLLLDTRETIRQGGESGPAVVPGKLEESLLLRALRHEGFKMPPEEKLPAEMIRDFERWIASGAADPRAGSGAKDLAQSLSLAAARKFWSFQPLQKTVPPEVKQTAWVESEIDRFVLVRLEQANLSPTPRADKRTLIRRATFDLTGLPPTPAEVDAFLADQSPAAFSQLIDRLLASPAYGERWGRHWLDVIRYADTAGETADFPSPHAWRYRNYVIDAFNADKPYDEFLREQLAGDLLAKTLPPDAPLARERELKIATGYIAIARRFGFNIEHDHYLTIEDTIDTLGKSVLGLTIGCARCHDHKYDPISARDYYAIYGIFDSTVYAFPGSEHVKQPANLVILTAQKEVDAAKKQHSDRLNELNAAVQAAEKALTEFQQQQHPELAQTKEQTNKPMKTAAPTEKVSQPDVEALQKLEAAVKSARQARDAHSQAPPQFDWAYAVAEGKPHNAQLHRRGNPKELGEEVPRRYLELFGGAEVPAEAGSGRLELAQWLTSAENPLTARVMVNRLWQHHFGAGLVATPNDFGTRGQPPSHPELLDYLAGKFIAGGWSIKNMHRLMMLSSVYQQSSATNEAALQTDAENRLLWHFPRRRLSVEELRDSLLSLSGELDRVPGGPHPFPPTNSWNFTQHNPFVASYATNKRSVYQMNQRIKLQPMQALFDGPDPNSSTPRRTTTTVPTQALFFLNAEFMHQRAAAVAGKLMAEPPGADRLKTVYRMLFGREPNDAERQTSETFFAAYTEELSGQPEAKQQELAWQAYVRVLMSTNEFVYVE